MHLSAHNYVLLLKDPTWLLPWRGQALQLSVQFIDPRVVHCSDAAGIRHPVAQFSGLSSVRSQHKRWEDDLLYFDLQSSSEEKA